LAPLADLEKQAAAAKDEQRWSIANPKGTNKRKGLSSDQYRQEYMKLRANEKDAQIKIKQSGRLKCNIELLSKGDLAKWAKQNGLAPLKVIVSIDAFLTQTKDEDLIPLSQLTEVKVISLICSKITDNGLSHIAGLKKLEVLYLGETQVGDSGLINLEELSELRELWLRGTRVTDKGIKHLRGLSKLEVLYISRTSLSDDGMRVIKNLASLKNLVINNTNVTDAGILELKNLKNLKYLDLYNTKTTPNGISELAKAIPGLQINTKAPRVVH
jgi:hypothetical protein